MEHLAQVTRETVTLSPTGNLLHRHKHREAAKMRT